MIDDWRKAEVRSSGLQAKELGLACPAVPDVPKGIQRQIYRSLRDDIRFVYVIAHPLCHSDAGGIYT